MPIRSICLLSLLVSATAGVAAEVPSRIDAVTLYPSGATITRVADVELAAGETELTLGGLVAGIGPRDLRASIEGNGAAIGEIRVNQAQRSEAYDAEVRRLTDAIAEMNAQIRAVSDDTRAQQLKVKFLESLAGAPGAEQSSVAADPATWSAALATIGDGSGTAFERIRTNERRLAELNRELSRLQRELADAQGGSLATSVVTVTATSPSAQSARLVVSYQQSDAGWSPRYEARLDSDAAELELTQQASISQRTDEDWRNVRLTLSTSAPSGQLAPPDVDSRFLYLARPVPAAAESRRRSAMQSVSDLAAAPLEEVVVSANRAVSRIGNYAVSYDIPGRVSVPNDSDDEQTFDIDRFEFEPTLLTQIVPRESSMAFLTARFDYEGRAPLFASDLTIYVDGMYAGTTAMQSALPGQQLTIPMGQDRRVEVDIKDQGEQIGDRGIVSKRREETTDLRYTITNRRSSPTRIEVLDVIPVARDEDIEVEVLRGATPPSERDLDNRPGVIVWERQLSGGDTWEIRHAYTISYPADRILRRQ